jgi:hypothetical protein
MSRQRNEFGGRLVWGFFLIALGAMLLAANLGVIELREVFQFWPFLLMAMGITQMFLSEDSEKAGGGFWLLLAGLYGWISIWHVLGLSWHTAWPIFVIAGGVSLLFKPVCSRRRDRVEPGASQGGAEHVG